MIITGNNLRLIDFINVVRNKEKVSLGSEAVERIKVSRNIIDNIVQNNEVVYGVTTGFGKLSNVFISKDDVETLQSNLLKSHACGVGERFSNEVVRGIMLLRINALSKGYSGVRPETLERLMYFLNEDIVPIIPEQGSLGASGDLAPLSHMALPIIGLGEVLYKGEVYQTNDLLKKLGLEPIRLSAKEGLSLINGTQAMTSVGALTLFDAINLAKIADIAGSLTMEALYGIRDAFDSRVHEVRGQIGQSNCAKNIRRLIKSSKYITKQGEMRVQDPYSLRCIPQVHGASRDALNYILEKVEIEMNAATDNPLIFSDAVISGGNFHGQPMALSFDFMKIAISELANISERRIERLVNPSLSEGLPPFLVKKSGVNSGFMIMQYSAASLVSENKVLSHPASVDSIPSSANQEDHVSMGTIAARGSRDILKNARKVLAIELMTNCQALDLREKKKLGAGTLAAYEVMRKHIPFIETDREMYPLINQTEQLIIDGTILHAVEDAIGKLN